MNSDSGHYNIDYNTESSSVGISRSQESSHESVHAPLKPNRVEYVAYAPSREPFAVVCFELDDSDSMSILNVQHGTTVFTGDPSGPSILHLRQNYNMLQSELKLKPSADLNDNDRFNFLMKFLGGGARDQAADLERRMRNELRAKNAASLDQYVRDRDAHTHAKALYDALPAAEKARATEPQPPTPHVDEEVYDKPIEKFWAMMEKLYPEKSTTRMDEFRNFAMRSGETIASLIQRMQSLVSALDRPEEMSVFKLLAAIRPAELGKEVQRQLHATGVEIENWTVESVGQIAIKSDCAMTQANLWTTTMQGSAPARALVRPQSGYTAPTNQGQRRPDSRACHNCGEIGHLARNCRKPVVVKGGSAQNETNPKDNSDHSCYHCGDPNHYAAQCPMKRAELAQPARCQDVVLLPQEGHSQHCRLQSPSGGQSSTASAQRKCARRANGRTRGWRIRTYHGTASRTVGCPP